MPCYHPFLGIDFGERNSETGGVYYRFKRIPPNFDPSWPAIATKDHGATFCSSLDPGAEFSYPYKLIPCGRCDGCRLKYSQSWAARCMMELHDHDSAYFVTLTYNDQFIPRAWYIDREDGQEHLSLTLRKRDFQLFMKRLRFAFPNDSIRFFAAGEYGDNTWRPHYHAIIFGLHLTDLVPHSESPEGFQYYFSPSFQRVWSQQVDLLGDRDKTCPYQEMGFALVAPVTWETCAYVSRYTMKKLRGAERHFYADFNLEPPFSLMSSKPGIGRHYYDTHPDLYDFNFINISTEKGGRKFTQPRYFDKIFEVEHPERMEEIKFARERVAKAAAHARLRQTTYNFLDMLAVQESSKKSQIKSLKRDSF